MDYLDIYRIEHSVDRTGPYQSHRAAGIKNLFDSHLHPATYKDGGRHPVPSDDRGLINAGADTIDYHFGFSSIEQLKSWFYHAHVLEWLHENSYVLVIYETHKDDMHKGWSRILFDLDKAYRKREVSIKEFLEKGLTTTSYYELTKEEFDNLMETENGTS